MFAILHALGMFVADLFKSRIRLESENLFFPHQLNLALRRTPPRPVLRGSDRAFMVWMIRLWPSLPDDHASGSCPFLLNAARLGSPIYDSVLGLMRAAAASKVIAVCRFKNNCGDPLAKLLCGHTHTELMTVNPLRTPSVPYNCTPPATEYWR